MNTSRKKYFVWECSHSCTACCTSSSDLKDLPPIAALSGPKTWKSVATRSGEYGGCGRHSKDLSWIVTTFERGIWGRALSCCNKTPVLKVHVIWTWLQGAGDSWGDLHTLHWSQCSPWAFSAPYYPSFIPKDSQHNLSRKELCAEFFSVLVRRYGAIPCSVSWFPAGGWEPRFHLQ